MVLITLSLLFFPLKWTIISAVSYSSDSYIFPLVCSTKRNHWLHELYLNCKAQKKQNINYNMEHSNITTWYLCFFFFLSCFISFRAPNASLKKKEMKKKTLSIHSMTRFYLRTHCWMTAITSIHISYPPHSRLTPCLQLRLLTWHLFGKKMDRMWFGQYEWLIVCYKNSSPNIHELPVIHLIFSSGASSVDYLMVTTRPWHTGLVLCYHWRSFHAKHAGRLTNQRIDQIDWSNLALTLLWPSTGKTKEA